MTLNSSLRFASLSLRQEDINQTLKLLNLMEFSQDHRTAFAFYSVKYKFQPFIAKLYSVNPGAFSRQMTVGGETTSIYSMVSDPHLLRWLIKGANVTVPLMIHVDGREVPFLYHF